MTITLPDRRCDVIVQTCRSIISKPATKIRLLSRAIGLMLAAEIAVPYGAIFRRDLEIEKNLALQSNQGDFEATIPLSNKARYALQWWASNSSNSSSPIHRNVDLEVETDASLEGWGAYCPTNKM